MHESGCYQIHNHRRVNVLWQDGVKSCFAFIRLRHYCNYPVLGRPEQSDDSACRIPESPDSPAIQSIAVEQNEVVIRWSHNNSVTRYQVSLLLKNRVIENSISIVNTPVLWSGKDAVRFKWYDVKDLKKPDRLLTVFKQLRDHGILLLKNLPTKPNTLFNIAKHFGPVRHTHFGEIFDIRSLPQDQLGTGANIGATASNSQAPHMDEGWRHGPQVTIIESYTREVPLTRMPVNAGFSNCQLTARNSKTSSANSAKSLVMNR